MSSCKLVIKDEVNVKFENLSLEWRKRLSNKFKYEIPYARHLPAVKLGRWDGKVSFFGLGGTTYLNLVDQIIPMLDEGGVYIDVEDKRPKHNFEFLLIVGFPSTHQTIFASFPPTKRMNGKAISN